jgi:hypothetical protein
MFLLLGGARKGDSGKRPAPGTRKWTAQPLEHGLLARSPVPPLVSRRLRMLTGTGSRLTHHHHNLRAPSRWQHRRSRLVELEHGHIDRHGPGWPALRAGANDDQGWPLYLARDAAILDAQAA